MSKEYKRTLITTALPYTNGPVHIGHRAGVYVPADIYARSLRLAGRPVTLIGGRESACRRSVAPRHRGPLSLAD